MANHTFVIHAPDYHRDEYWPRACMVCDGGLGICTVCHCIEGSLATECPGFDCWKEYGDRIYQGKIDFRDGRWVEGQISICSPQRGE